MSLCASWDLICRSNQWRKSTCWHSADSNETQRVADGRSGVGWSTHSQVHWNSHTIIEGYSPKAYRMEYFQMVTQPVTNPTQHNLTSRTDGNRSFPKSKPFQSISNYKNRTPVKWICHQPTPPQRKENEGRKRTIMSTYNCSFYYKTQLARSSQGE